MTNHPKKTASLTLYVCVLLGGFSVFFMLLIERQSAKSIQEETQALMYNTVTKTISVNISDALVRYPLSVDDIENNWTTLPTDFIAFKQQQLIYPHYYMGNASNTTTDLWALYNKALASNVESKLNVVTQSPESEARIHALFNIKKALISEQSGKQNIIAKSIQDYFTQVENFRLSALEEVISGLSFLSINTNARWNDDLIDLVLFKGNLQSKPIVEWLFKHSQGFSMADAKLAISTIYDIIYPTGLDPSWFQQHETTFWQTKPTFEAHELTHLSVIEQQWICLKTQNQLSLLIPFALQQELKKAQGQLTKLSVLDPSDSIYLAEHTVLPKIIDLAYLPITIERTAWLKQDQQQILFFTIKLLLLLTLIASLLVLTKAFSIRHKKRMEYVSLRENFINLVSHELKTPLASIRIMVETLHKRNQRQLSIKDYPNKIVNEVDRLWLMVDNLLSLHQIKSGELKLNVNPCHLSEIINAVANKLNEATPNSIHLSNNVAKNISVMLDPILFELVIINLFSNAIKYCNKPKVEVTLEFLPLKQQLLIHDNGEGIAQKNQLKVFDDFYRQSMHSGKQGSGVGLSLCKQIMMLHNGQIFIQKSSERGTTWVLQFQK